VRTMVRREEGPLKCCKLAKRVVSSAL
jgi:hypothetical protein